MAKLVSRIGLLVILFLFCVVIAGCMENKKLTKANFDQIKNGMSLKEVQTLLGDETRGGGDGANVAGQFGVDVTSGSSAGGGEYVWESGTKSITVTFKKNVVSAKKSSGL